MRVLLTLASVCAALALSAQTMSGDSTVEASNDSVVNIVAAINGSGNIYIEQNEALTRRLCRKAATEQTATGHNTSKEATVVATRNGYRVQVFDDNNPGTARGRAEACRARVAAMFPHWRAYVTFNSPYWQVRVGDFKRRGEAESALAQIRESMPSVAAYARIVSEKINITE